MSGKFRNFEADMRNLDEILAYLIHTMQAYLSARPSCKPTWMQPTKQAYQTAVHQANLPGCSSLSKLTWVQHIEQAYLSAACQASLPEHSILSKLI